MNKKTLVQLTLLSLIIIISVSFFNVYFFNEKEETVQTEIKKEVKSDIIKDLQYLSKDAEGNTYLINAKSGIADNENPDIIHLQNVNAKISFDYNKEIIIKADNAIYNNDNYDTDFYDNVTLDYDYRHLTCKNIQVKFSENYAKIYNNVVYSDYLTKLFADKIEVDLIKRTSKISMFKDKNKIKVTHNNGIN